MFVSRSLSLVLIAFALTFTPAFAQAQAFFLSTEKIVAPGDVAQVKLEAKDLGELEMRLYRVEDPAAYFDRMADLHRPKEDLTAPRASQLQALRRGLQLGLHALRRDLRTRFKQRARDAIREVVDPAVKAADRAVQPAKIERKVPLLKGHDLIESWTQSLPEREGWYYGRIDVPAREPGVYIVEAVNGSRVAHTVVIVSEVALITKQSADALLVWAVDPKTGAPKPSTEVTVKVRGTERAKKKTGADGLVRFALEDSPAPVVYGALESSFTVLDPRFFRANVEAPRVYVFTERPVYRLGQTVHLKGFARSLDDETYAMPKSPAGTKLQVSIIDAKGRTHARRTAELSDRGSFNATFALPDAPAYGTWTAMVELDGSRYGGEFKVLAFEKPEVQLRVRLDRPTLRPGDTLGGDVVGRYFYGSPYPEAKVKITVTRTRFYVPWYVDTDYAWYYSEAEYRSTARDVVHEQECVLDDKGICPFEFVASDDGAESTDYTYVVEAVSQDPNGRTIVGVGKATMTTGAFRLQVDQPAVVVEPGDAQTITVRAVDYAGVPVQTTVNVAVRARRTANDGLVEVVEALSESKATDEAGVAKFSLNPRQRGYYEIVATAKDDRQADIKAEGFLFAAAESGGVAMTPGDLTLVTDKRSYFSGETALVLVLTPAPEAKVLFTVEGGALYDAKVLAASGHATVVSVPIGDRQSPNFFLSAATVIDGQLYSRTRSVIVPPREKILRVEVAPDRTTAQPGDEVGLTVMVTDAAGKPVADAEVALGIVDEAIYAVSPEIAVPLEAFFHPRKRNDVRLSDSLTFRFFGRARNTLGPTAGRAMRRPYAFGALKPQADDRDEFKDTAAWWPSLVTDAEGRATVKLTLPDNLTTWRATARVVTRTTQVGRGVGRIVSKKPLVVRLALPHRTTEGDRGEGGLLVQNLSGKDETFTVSAEVEGNALALALEPKGVATLEPKGASTNRAPLSPVTLPVKSGELARIPVRWDANAAGDLEIRVSAEGGGHKDQVVRAYTVAPWVDVAETSVAGTLTENGATFSRTLNLPPSVDLSKAKLTVALSNSPLAAARASLSGLVSFPYGCTEQTMSRFVPVLVAKAALDRWNLDVPELQDTVPRFVSAGIARLGELQNDDGSWGWFQEGLDPWMTAWVVEGLAEARSLGATVDAAMLSRGAEALRRRLNAEGLDPAMRAFAVYALAKANDPSPAMVQRLLEDDAKGRLSSAGLAYTLMAAQLVDDKAMIQIARDRLLSTKHMKSTRDGAAWCTRPSLEAERQPVECTALALRALATSTGTTAAEAVRTGTNWLMSRFEGDGFGSTRSTALTVRALAATAKKPTGPTTVRLWLDNEDYGPTTVDAVGAPKILAPSVVLTKRRVRVRLKQEGDGRTHVHVRIRGPERKTVFEAQRNGLSIRREFRRLEGSEGSFRAGRSSRSFEEGDPVLVVLKVKASRPTEHVLIEAPHPAGMAPVLNDAGLKVRGVQRQPKGAFREHRPDRTAFFLRRMSGTVELSYLMRATLPGRYRTLPSRGESMYLPSRINGRSLSTDVRVTAR